jgi:carboxymethylenebutenolidase
MASPSGGNARKGAAESARVPGRGDPARSPGIVAGVGNRAESIAIEVEGGALPARVVSPEASRRWPALVVIPSIFGPAPDLIARLTPLADRAQMVFPDPFWRVGGGVVPYGEHAKAVARLSGFDLRRCIADLGAVVDWCRARCNGRVAGLGICFGGPFVLRFAGEGRLDGGVTWHGSRMENFLDRAASTTCPLRLHFGAEDPITPPAAIEKIRAAFAAHPDVAIAIHPGAVHGYSHDGEPYDARACQAGLDAVRELLGSLVPGR